MMHTAQCGFESDPQKGPSLLEQSGPTLLVDIGFSGDGPQLEGIPNLAAKGIDALIDTGATDCCIDSSLAMSLQLPIVDQRAYGGIAGAHLLNVHLAQMYVPKLGFSMFGRFAGVDLKGSGQPHGALIGRNFLKNFQMVYNGLTGQVEITGAAPPAT